MIQLLRWLMVLVLAVLAGVYDTLELPKKSVRIP